MPLAHAATENYVWVYDAATELPHPQGMWTGNLFCPLLPKFSGELPEPCPGSTIELSLVAGLMGEQSLSV